MQFQCFHPPKVMKEKILNSEFNALNNFNNIEILSVLAEFFETPLHFATPGECLTPPNSP